jgi:glycosyltransferase involved in cell wall biosynthesis
MSGVPLVSVVVPCFNTERYIAEALGSILAQHIDSVQIIVIDDGSTDGSAAIIRGYGEQIEYHKQPNGGICAARNAGIALARGTYLAFLDADDIWPAASLKLRLEKLRQGAECVYGGVEHFISPELDDQGRQRFGTLPPNRAGRLAGAMLIERQAFNRVGMFDPALKIGEMMDWVARAEQAVVTTALFDDIVLRRRIHGNNTVLRLKSQQGEYLKALRGAIERRREAAVKGQT